jgi:hypothetical protein
LRPLQTETGPRRLTRTLTSSREIFSQGQFAAFCAKFYREFKGAFS